MLAARGGKIKKGYKEGGKVDTGLAALKALAKKVEAALASGDTELAKRLKRQMEAMKRGSSKTADDAEELEVAEEKLATFAKGGKVKSVKKVAGRSYDALRKKLTDLEAKIAYGEIDKKTNRVKGETEEQRKAHDEYDKIYDEIETRFGVIPIDDQ
jgi:hypothetical protein